MFDECCHMSSVSASLCRPNNPCQNGGSCWRGPSRTSFQCACPHGYNGKLCDVGKYNSPNCSPSITAITFTLNSERTVNGFCLLTGPNDCYEGDGEFYNGMVSETVEGEDCLHWNSYFILQNGADPFKAYEGHDGIGPNNYCR